ncbi:5-hydroxytryptamine receptor 7-like [Nematostella vectensis]|uniref:5-hydroxytryptamine receptor 7-like n=1 Tax=Nematostella vectensis TaxID=45351 RepID=UPI0013900108|nr:5-hydroxytryptamine receptor 7-like [Nematostella vectensis]
MRFGGPPECGNISGMPVLSFSSTGISLLLTCISAPTNVCICLAIYKDPYKNLKTAFNLLIVNITLADLLQGLIVMPLSVAFHALEGSNTMSIPLIRSLHVFTFLSCTASVLSIAALAIDRCFSITNPLQYRAKLTYRRSLKVSLMVWLFSIALTFLYFQVDFIAYTFVYVNSVLLLTLAVLFLVQIQVWSSLRRHRKKLKLMTLPSYTNGVNICVRNEDKLLQKRDTKVTKTFLTLLAFFLILNAPAFIFAYLLNFCDNCSCNTIHIFRDIHFLSLLFPSSINPFLFGWRLPNFKRALQKVVLRRSSVQEESPKDLSSVGFLTSLLMKENYVRHESVIFGTFPYVGHGICNFASSVTDDEYVGAESEASPDRNEIKSKITNGDHHNDSGSDTENKGAVRSNTDGNKSRRYSNGKIRNNNSNRGRNRYIDSKRCRKSCSCYCSANDKGKVDNCGLDRTNGKNINGNSNNQNNSIGSPENANNEDANRCTHNQNNPKSKDNAIRRSNRDISNLLSLSIAQLAQQNQPFSAEQNQPINSQEAPLTSSSITMYYSMTTVL